MGTSLKDWLNNNQTIESKQKVFYNMSKTLEYINDRGYHIKSFNPKEIEIMDLETLNPIQYNTVLKIPKNKKEEVIRSDIYNLAFVQISTYSQIPLERLKPKFLKENFSQFEQFLPDDDKQYFKKIIVYGDSAYYHDYVNYQNNKQIKNLEEEIIGAPNSFVNNSASSSNSLGFQKTKATAVGKNMVDRSTEKLYKPLTDYKDAAFVNFMIFPICLIVLGMIMGIILLIYG